MGECAKCGDQVSMPFTCKFCKQRYCSKHRLPENHDCTGLESYKEQRDDPRITYDIQREEKEYRDHHTQPPRNAEPGVIQRLKGKWFNLKHRMKQLLTPDRPQRFQRQPFTGAMRQTFPEIATFSLLGIILITFLLQQSISGFMDLFSLKAAFLAEEPWRIVTSMFLHANSAHLLINAMVLYFFGATLERRVGTTRFLKIFLLSGIVASLGFGLYAYLAGRMAIPAVGASGALYGVFATLAIIAPEIRVLAFFVIPMSIRTALVGFAFLDLFLLTQNTPIASAAHLSGLVTGLYYGYRLKQQQQQVDLFRHRPGF